eukprot:13872469-Alexandrium_andersonii.AAC.1
MNESIEHNRLSKCDQSAHGARDPAARAERWIARDCSEGADRGRQETSVRASALHLLLTSRCQGGS